MPIYGSMDERFNVALANKMKNADANSAANTMGANAQMMNAQSTADQVGSLNDYRTAGAQAHLMNAGTSRMGMAGENPMGFSADQVNSMGLRSAGALPSFNATMNSNALYGPGANGGMSLYAQRQSALPSSMAPQPSSVTGLKDLNSLRPSNTALPFSGGTDFNTMRQQGRAHGGRIGHDINNNDDVPALLSEGEVVMPNGAVAAAGGGDHKRGVRVLEDFIRRTTGNEPGPTYAKKSKAGYAKGGSVSAKKKGNPYLIEEGTDPMLLTGHYVPTAGDPSTAMPPTPYPAPDYTDGRDALMARQASAPIQQPVTPPAARGMSNPAWNRMVDATPVSKTGYPMFDKGGEAKAPYDHIAERNKREAILAKGLTPQALGRGVRTSASNMSFLNNPFQLAKDAATIAKLPSQAIDWMATNPFVGAMTGLGDVGFDIPPELADVRPGGKAPAGASANMKARFGVNPHPEATPFASQLLGKEPPQPSLHDMVQQEAAKAEVPMPMRNISETPKDFAIRDAIQAGGKPGQQIALNYGPGHGMPEGSAPIIATADKNGRYNMFGGGPGLRMARGGEVPQYGLGGVIKGAAKKATGWFRKGAEAIDDALPEIDGMPDVDADIEKATSDRQAKQDAVRARADAQYRYKQEPFRTPEETSEVRSAGAATRANNAAGARAASAAGAAKAEADAAAAAKEARRSGANYRAAYTEPINVKEGIKSAAKTVGNLLPTKLAGMGLRGLAGVAPYVAPVVEAGGVLDVMTDPKKTWTEAGTQAASSAGKLASAGLGAATFGALGSMTGPLAPVAAPIGALAGGIGGYMAGKEGIEWARGKLGMGDVQDPNQTSYGVVKKMLGMADPNAVPTETKMDSAPFMQNNRAALAAGADSGGGGLRAQPQPQGAPPPDIREQMMRRVMMLGGGGPGAMREQQNLVHLLSAGEGGRGGNGEAARAKALADHEKEIEASLRPRFQKSVVDEKGKQTKVDDLESYEQFLGDMASRNVPIMQMDRRQRDQILAEWQARHRIEERAHAIQAGSGDPTQSISQRTMPMNLRKQSMGIDDWWGSPNIKFWDDYVGSFSDKGLRNRVAERTVIDPNTGKPVKQLFPAAKVFGDEKGVDLDAVGYARGQ